MTNPVTLLPARDWGSCQTKTFSYTDLVFVGRHCKCLQRDLRRQTSRPMKLISIYFLTVEKSKGGYENILVINGLLTRYVNTFSSIAAWAMHENYSFHANKWRNSDSNVMKDICKTANDRTNGTTALGNLTVRFYSTLIRVLGQLVDDLKADWIQFVPSLS